MNYTILCMQGRLQNKRDSRALSQFISISNLIFSPLLCFVSVFFCWPYYVTSITYRFILKHTNTTVEHPFRVQMNANKYRTVGCCIERPFKKRSVVVLVMMFWLIRPRMDDFVARCYIQNGGCGCNNNVWISVWLCQPLSILKVFLTTRAQTTILFYILFDLIEMKWVPNQTNAVGLQ